MERNGISLDQLQATVDAVTAHPELYCPRVKVSVFEKPSAR